VVLGFFNLVPLAALVVVVEMASVCVLLHPESIAARYVSDWVSGALQLTALLAAAVSIMQLVPGGPRWRDIRQSAGIVNLALVWPAVCALGLIAFLEIPGGLRACP
jgi:hypothetical protein